MNKAARLILLLATAFFFDASAGRNFVIIGSSAAPVKYIRGTGSNVGLYAGIELQSGAVTFQNTVLTKTTFARSAPIGFFRGSEYIPGGGAQGMGKKAAVVSRSLPLNLQPGDRTLSRHCPAGARSSALAKTTATSPKISFQVLPFLWMNIPAGTSSAGELLLPVLCQDQFADVPDSNGSANFTTGQLDSNSAGTYVGIYRIDQYLNDVIAGKILSDGNGFLYDPSEISESELLLTAHSHFILDSTVPQPEYPGYYNVTRLFLEPQQVNYAIWAARGNQDEDACRSGLDHILETNHLPPASDSEAVEVFHFNHIVFAFAQMPAFQARFRAPGGTLPTPPDLRPYAIIEWSPDSADLQNQNGGVQFSSTYSFDADGGIAQRKWDFGDGTASEDGSPSHVFEKNGSYKVRLTVTDNAGNQGNDSIAITISSAGVVKNNRKGGKKDILFYQSGKAMLPAGRYPVPGSRLTVEFFNARGQRIFSAAAQSGIAKKIIDPPEPYTKGSGNVVIWRLKIDNSCIAGKSVFLKGN